MEEFSQSYFKDVFGYEYFTGINNTIFNNSSQEYPNGYFIKDNNLILIVLSISDSKDFNKISRCYNTVKDKSLNVYCALIQSFTNYYNITYYKLDSGESCTSFIIENEDKIKEIFND